jgi:hypothetical protein
MELQQALNVLEEHGYQITNLWTIEDVKANYNCTNAEAFEILENALDSEDTMEQIWSAIDIKAGEMGFHKIDNE